MKKKYILAASVAAVALVAVVAATSTGTYKLRAPFAIARRPLPAANTIAAKVNGEVITVDEIRKGYVDNPQIAEQVPFDEFYAKAVDVFVNGKLLYQAAVKADVQSLPAYKTELNIASEDIARKVYLEKTINEQITPAMIEKFYQDEYIAKFVSKKEMGAKHILLDNEKTAKEVIEKLNKGENFDKLAEKYTKDKTVELGYFTEDLMVPEFVKAAKQLKKGQYTKTPVKTQFGYHIILLEDVRDSKPLPLEELEPQIKNILTQKVVAETFDNLYKTSNIEKFDLNGNKIDEKAKVKD